MKKIVASDLKNLHEYELIRDDWRKDVIATKARRRVLVGPTMSLVFENRLTVLNQIQEMCRAERLVKPDAVQAEIDVYNELLPGPGEVAATLFIEITEQPRIQEILDGFIGLDEPGHLALTVGGRRFPALFAPGQSREDRISAVHYIRFPLGEEGSRALSAGEEAALDVAHGDYRARQVLSKETVEELVRDLG